MMSISRAEAESALRDVDTTQSRVQEAIANHGAAPHLIMWGLIWMVGYLGTGSLGIERGAFVWLPLIAIGSVGSAVIGYRQKARYSANLSPMVSPVVAIVIALFFFATFSVFKPSDPSAYLVFPGLVVGLVYTLMGLVRMYRMMWIGAAMLVLTYAGHLFLQPYIAIWMAVVGGLGLVIGGLWMRSA